MTGLRQWLRHAFCSGVLGPVLLFALLAMYCLGVLGADLTLWPGRRPTILLAVPILLAALWQPPLFVLGISAVALTVDAIDLVSEPPDLKRGILLGMALMANMTLVGISFVGLVLSTGRQKAFERQQRQEALIRTVESLRQPLTVILGYSQFLDRQRDVPVSVKAALARIVTAAANLKQQIDRLLNDSTAARE